MSDEQPKRRSWFEKLLHFMSHEPQDKEALLQVLADAKERDLISAEVLSMIESVLQVSDMQVREVMIPRSQMVLIEKESKLETILPVVIASGHSRFPVVENADQEIIGTILAKDLLQYCFHQEDKQFDLADILRPATFVPQSKRLDILLKEFRINRNHMAIVIDEYGHVAGLVTIEDVLEQIVGDIEDEYDIDEDDYIKKISDTAFTIKATTPIEEFNEYFNATLKDDEFDTIGGIILKGFGHLPKRGEKFKFENFTFKVLQSDDRRIHLLEIKLG